MNAGSRELFAALRSRPGITAAAVVATIGAVLFEVAIPLLTGSALDVATGAIDSSPATNLVPWVEPLTAIIVVLIGVAVARYGCQFARRYASGRLSIDTQHVLRTRILDTLQRLDGPGQDRIVTGQVVSRSISDLNATQGLVAMGPWALGMVIQLIITVGIMLSVSPLLTVIALAFLPVIVTVAFLSRRSLYAATWVAQQSTADLATHVEQTVTGVRVVKAFAQENRVVDQLESLGRTLYAAKMRAARIMARFQPLLQNLPRLALVINILLGGWLVLRGEITVGVFFAFSVYLTSLTQIVGMLSGLVVTLQMGLASLDRIADILRLEPGHHDPADPEDLPDGPLGLRLDDVHFDNDGHRVLDGLSLDVAPGEIVALIGPPGSGKSMAVQLAGGFYVPDSGRFLLTTADGRGVDYRRLTDAAIRSAVTCVFDEAFLYSSSIRDNITMGAPGSDDDVRRAARIAQADGFISELSEGYDTVVGERGLTLSGGQRQRIALARALFARPRVLILDDATSAIDATTEARILGGLREELTDVTVIAIAHRQSTLDLAQRVAILDAGRITVTGPVHEVREDPRFQRLMNPELSPAPVARREVAEPDHATLWPAPGDVDTGPTEHVTDQSGAVGGRGGGGIRGAITATPELLERVKKLPPATEQPRIDTDRLRADRADFRVRDLFRAVRWLLVAVVVLLIVGVVTDLAFPTLMRWAIDLGVAENSTGTLWRIAGLGVLVVAVSWVAAAWLVVLTSRTGERLLFGLRLRSFAHLQRLSMNYYETNLSGRIMTRMTTDIDTLSSFLQTGLAQAIVAVGTLVGILGMLVYTDAGLSLVAVAAIPLIVVVTLVFRRISSRLYTQAREQISAVNAAFQENVNGLRTAQMHGRTPLALREFAAESEHYRRLRVRSQTAVAAYFPGVNAISQVTTAVVLGVGATRVAGGELSAGVLVAFVMYLAQLYGPIQQLGQIFDSWQQATVGLRRITDLLAERPTVVDSGTRDDAARAARGELALDDVSFAYSEGGTVVARQLDLDIEPGSTVALVGPTGAGKSTVIKLLARFYDPVAGTVTAAGTDIRDFPLPAWRRAVAQVPQEAHLFIGTVAENIAYGLPEADERDLTDAVRRIGALDVIAAIPGGFRQPVGERGRGLSSGQRQLIALARAELLRPDVMLLDEATATLDPATEAAVLDATDRVTVGRTSVIVAHRLATAARADRIVVVDKGRIIEDGSHSDLLARDGVYAAMWRVHR
ncbi:ABC transporter ATP-binding protein [Corynebacterium halotolerans]|uniref:Multidrug resistance protein n=1 Tax=Corynebacterium halotolerans YIM 70093 = DSM 44683 TaxID=1121362 RepID=M1NXD1_9CORY|nr:ABC transporter ATP-binding protein [Corynebacterium halotolerans]AGF72150.1 multidrug resistance protein [Corynebacterium halotolerans YIM 70093 = DSM 44683]